jgi:D-glycero-alpha-D-manno-heptose 1-phosphate guanylyltransferase
MEGIILAGGMGTRLQTVVSNVPKCMAPIAGQPFLYYLLKNLETAGFRHILLSLGYKHEWVEEWITTAYRSSLKISFIVENEPLGTGGAVKLALSQAEEEAVFVLNGDTFLQVDYRKMLEWHTLLGIAGLTRNKLLPLATLALKEMVDFDRYGIVETNVDSRISCFKEKRPCRQGLINGGVYLINRDALTEFPEKFSLEKDFFEKTVASERLLAFPTQGYFIDIGIPEDYRRAQNDFANGKQYAL